MAYSPEQLSDIQCIRDCAQRYCRGVDRLDEALMKSAYWPDATDDHGAFFKGLAMDFIDQLPTIQEPMEILQHNADA